MFYLAAVVALIGLVTVANFIFTLGVVRRLRDHTDRLAGLSMNEHQRTIMAAGERPADFTAKTVDGELISRDSLPGGTMIAFLQPSCEPCREETPDFLDQAAAAPSGRDSVLAVVVRGRTGTAAYAEQLGQVARVVVEPPEGPISTAFAVRVFPSFVELDADGAVLATGHRLSRMSMSRTTAAAR